MNKDNNMDIDWQYYQGAPESNWNLESDLYEYRDNPFMGIQINPSDEEWDERPDNKKYVIYPTALKQNMDWKDFVVVEDFLTDMECEILIKYQEGKINLELQSDQPSDSEYSKYNTYFRDEGNIHPTGEYLSRKKKVFNHHLNKYEFIPKIKTRN